MKRTISVICAAALVMFVACQKEETTASKVALTATLEQQVDNGATKTSLNPTNNVIWSVGDQIKVRTTAGLETLTLTSGQGITGSFGSTTGDNPDYAIYPASACASLSGSTFTFTLPATQTYAENSFGPGANVAVAAISGSNMAFKNVCGVLKLQLKGSMKVKTIELTGKSGEKLSGAFTVDVAANPFIGAVKEGEPTEAEKKVTLDCSAFGETSEGAADGGVQLDFKTSTRFYFIVPVSAFAHGFEAKITDVAGETFYVTLETTEDNTIARSTITRMPSKAVSLLPAGFTELEYIESTDATIGRDPSSSGPFINTAVCPGPETGWQVSLMNKSGVADKFLNGAYDKPTSTRFTLGVDIKLTVGYQRPFPTLLPFETWTTVTVNLCNNRRLFAVNDAGQFEKTLEAIGPSLDFPVLLGGCFCNYDDHAEYKCYKQCLGIVRITEGNTFIRFFIPCSNADGTVGMCDVINGEFYTNAGGKGSFIAGPVQKN